ncbi:hypothetical protein [Nocardia arthritidis]|uniref:Phospholipase n=1 Tax=Nocardia arthritidis TaxID=228602 RepID=A0A6G9YF05_9NOCA|nr:hypothetical protein [Nocardia arthritidis]QIS11865.1 hypothetical protein F5544_19985 [Nocardia arthritidis]
MAAAVVLIIGAIGVMAEPPDARAKPINPYVPCPEWQAQHPGWPCWGIFPEIEEPTPPNIPGPPPTVPQVPNPVVPQPGTAPPPAEALTPPTLPHTIDPCRAIVPAIDYVPPTLPGNEPSAPCSAGPQDIGFCPFGHNPDGSCRGHSAINGSGTKIEVPDDYIYDPNCEHVPAGRTCDSWVYMHDYCSGAPDQFPAPGANADFRGPCARHDMCLENGGTNNFCNNQLFDQMLQNCKYAYGYVDPRFDTCSKTALVYWTAVTTFQPPIPGKNGPWG